jgi:Fe-S oxidoreductase
MHCNGNGACYDWDTDDVMCPSWKATRERRHSPKGRAMLVKEWLHRLSLAGIDPLAESARLRGAPTGHALAARLRNRMARRRNEADFSHAVKEAMDGCLACKACAGGCPIKVDVPSFRARFLELYHGRYPRPARDYLVGWMEHLVPAMARVPGLANALTGAGSGMLRGFGIVDPPLLSGLDIRRELAARGVDTATPEALGRLDDAARRDAVVIVQDAFTSFYETRLLLDVVDLLRHLGVTPWVAPFLPNGKPMHVHGMLGPFARLAEANAAMLRALAHTGVDLVGIDPSMTLTYRSEYVEAVGQDAVPQVLLLQEWLARRTNLKPAPDDARPYQLLPHCTERTNAPAAPRQWQEVFAALGLRLEVLASGCCGMAGTYGHETEHRDTSALIYAQGWQQKVAARAGTSRLLATGYSCRSQVKRLDGISLPHPAQAVLAALAAPAAARA